MSLALTPALIGCATISYASTFSTAVEPTASEDLAGPCTYDLLLLQPSHVQTGVLVIFERGDSQVLYDDPRLRSMAYSLDYAMIFAHQCNAKSFDDIQPDAARGPGRALLSALVKFADETVHPELATSQIVLNGFSAAGILTLTMENFAPKRVREAIAYAPGSPYLDLTLVSPGLGAMTIPTLILASADDRVAGTTRGHNYFQRVREEYPGAPWGFAVQNNTVHCCNITTLSMLLAWIPAVAAWDGSSGLTVQFVCSPNGVGDIYHETNCAFTDARIDSRSGRNEESAWLPDANAADVWLRWVTNPDVNERSVSEVLPGDGSR